MAFKLYLEILEIRVITYTILISLAVTTAALEDNRRAILIFITR